MRPNDPAYPCPSDEDPSWGTVPCSFSGLTIRAELAGRALTGYLAMHAGDGVPMPAADLAARDCAAYADALLAELAKPSSPKGD